jgi:hypothetical protein
MLGDGDEIAQLAEVNVIHGVLPSLIPRGYYRRASRSWTGGTPAAHRGTAREQQNATPHLSWGPLVAAEEKGTRSCQRTSDKGGYVVTVDPDLPDLPVGDVLVADGLIAAVGAGLEPSTTAAEVIDAAGRLVIPGMVDTHRHVWQVPSAATRRRSPGPGTGPRC